MAYMRLFSGCLFSLFALNASAQITGGQHVFQFLRLSPSARITALGGSQIAVQDDDPGFAALNPAALNPSMAGQITLQHNLYLSDIQHGYAAYAWHMPKIGFTAHGGIQYMDYGSIPMADEFGTVVGEVKASETAFVLGAARPLSDRITLGMNLRFALSALDSYNSNALAADIGGMYADTARRFTIGLVWRNLGVQTNPYNDTREDLLSDLQVGFSKRLKHLPFRFSVIAHRLNDWDLRYDDPNAQDSDVILFGGEADNNDGNPAIDNFFRHFIFNGEFLFGRNDGFRLRFGYNHLRKQELSVSGYRGLAGFSGGVGIRTKKIRIDAGYGAYHLAGGVFHMGLGTNLKEIF
jgi:hypothetical protein